MLRFLLSYTRDVFSRVGDLEIPFNRHGIDPYGVDQRDVARFLTFLRFVYRDYLTAEVFGVENVPVKGRGMLVGNHSGGYPVDAGMVIASCFFEMNPPRLAQGMADKFLSALPFSSEIFARIGQFTGLPEHSERLLNDERLLMIFPEGHRGTSKLGYEADKLLKFGTGFMRQALATNSPVIPFAFVGAGEIIPTIKNLEGPAKLLGIPYIPVTKYGPPIPLPKSFQLLYGEPMMFEGNGNESDVEIEEMVEQVRNQIQWLIQQGRDLREGRMKLSDLDLSHHSAR